MANDDLESIETLTGDEKIVARAKKRFQYCMERYGASRQRFIEDLKFANADPDNGYQWPQALWGQRRDDPNGYTPRLTINKTRVHNLQIINDAKQNKPGVNIRPVGGDASYDAAQVYESLIRDIERQSRAEQAYDTATTFQVQCGIGYIRVVTDYASPDTFDQEIFIRRVKNPLSIFLDPDVNEVDASDAKFGFAFEDVPRLEFYRDYPEMRGRVGGMSALDYADGWVDQDHVRVCEYYEREMIKDELWLMDDPDTPGGQIIARKSKIPHPVRAAIKPEQILKKRQILDPKIMWYKVAANEVIERTEWKGKYIPIVPVIGEQTMIEKQLDFKGHTRNMKDAQRMYNFMTSQSAEHVATQTKTRWFIPVGGSDNLESYYSKLNTTNLPFIPYNAWDENGNALPPPTPIAPPIMSEAYVKSMQITQNEMMMTSGQYQSQFGENENAKSGKAIAERQRQGDNATYHFIDGLAIAIRQVGNIIIDLMPHVYDTPRIKMILAKDGTEQKVKIDPDQKEAYLAAKEGAEDDAAIIAVLNPNVGRYSVESDVGPSYSTRRQEAWNAFVQITSQNADLVKVIGDLMFRYADFPGANDIAERLKRMVPPNVLGVGPDPEMAQLAALRDNLQGLYSEALQTIAELQLKVKDNSGRDDVGVFDAETRRLAVLKKDLQLADPGGTVALIRQVIAEVQKSTLAGVAPGEAPSATAEAPIAATPPVSPVAAPAAMANGAGA